MGQAKVDSDTFSQVRHTKPEQFIGDVGFFNAATSSQPTAVPDASGGATIDAEARTALNDLLARLRTLGIIAT